MSIVCIIILYYVGAQVQNHQFSFKKIRNFPIKFHLFIIFFIVTFISMNEHYDMILDANLEYSDLHRFGKLLVSNLKTPILHYSNTCRDVIRFSAENLRPIENGRALFTMADVLYTIRALQMENYSRLLLHCISRVQLRPKAFVRPFYFEFFLPTGAIKSRSMPRLLYNVSLFDRKSIRICINSVSISFGNRLCTHQPNFSVMYATELIIKRN